MLISRFASFIHAQGNTDDINFPAAFVESGGISISIPINVAQVYHCRGYSSCVNVTNRFNGNVSARHRGKVGEEKIDCQTLCALKNLFLVFFIGSTADFYSMIFKALFLSSIMLDPVFAVQESDWEKGQRLYFQDKLQLSEQFLKKALQEKPDHAGANSLLGDIYFLKGDYGKAVSQFKKALETSAKPADEYYRLGEVSLAQEKFAEARTYFNQSLKANSLLVENLFQLGLVELYGFRNKKDTITHWERFLQIRPNDRQADKIKAALNILKQESFVIPPDSSNIPMDEVLLLGGNAILPPDVPLEPARGEAESVRTEEKSAELQPDNGL
jgi:tetratricopeptide (TPR) repeat protein